MKGLAFVVAAAAALLAVGAAAQSARPEPPRPEDGYFQELTTIAPGVWLLAQPKFVVQPAGNVTIIEQADGIVLVDAGGSPGAARRVVQHVRRLSAKPVKAVVITHWHGDHPQGLAEILEAWPSARTISTTATRAHLGDPKTMNTPARSDATARAAMRKANDGFVEFTQRMAREASDPVMRAGWQASERLFGQYREDMDGAVTIAPRECFEGRLMLPDPRTPLEVRELGRANTDGDAVVWLPRQRILVTGDIVVAPIPFGFGSYPREWLGALDRVRAFDFAVLVPGHGPPQRDRAYLDRLSAAITEVRAQVATLTGQGLTLAETRARIDASAQAKRFVGNDPWLAQWFGQYWLTPIVTSAYKEAKGEPIVQSLGR